MRLVAGYAIYDAIGSGGTAQVHIACRSEDGFVRVVATKHLRADRATSAELVTMLTDEARLVSRIRHPNVVPIIDVVVEPRAGGDGGDGEIVLVQEYVHGASLAQLVRALAARKATMPRGVASAIAVGMLNGLHAAHTATDEQGRPLDLVHRDVSPQNVILGADGVPRVLDFGMAKARGRSTRTATGVVKGKLAYMAPEQLRGRTLSARTDVWAAGVVLWEMLAGRRLFSGSEAEIVERIGLGDVSRPSKFNPDADALDDVVIRALSSSPEDRFDTADAMARAIETATAPAYPSVVGAWVTEVAGDELLARAALVARIEQEERARGETRRAAKGAPAVGEPPSPPSPPSPPTAGSHRSRWSAAALLTLLLVCVALVLRSGGADSPDAATAAPALAAADAALAVRPAGEANDANEANERERVAKGAALPSPPPLGHRNTRPRARPVATGADPCAIPYVFDESGHKIYKRECLR